MTSKTITEPLTGSRAGSPGHTDRHPHISDRGFCSVCGAVWPCAQASSAMLLAGPGIPVPR